MTSPRLDNFSASRALASLPLPDRAFDRTEPLEAAELPATSAARQLRTTALSTYFTSILPLLIAATFNGMAVAAVLPGYICLNGVSTRASDRRIETMPRAPKRRRERR